MFKITGMSHGQNGRVAVVIIQLIYGLKKRDFLTNFLRIERDCIISSCVIVTLCYSITLPL